VSYPYYYYPPLYPYDPFAITYVWMSQWMYMLSMMYYMEMFKTMMETWRKFAESAFKQSET